MVVANVSMKNGEVQTFYAQDFPELFQALAPYENDIVLIRGKTIRLKDMRQGKETKNNGNHEG